MFQMNHTPGRNDFFTPNFETVPKCKKCGSFNITFDSKGKYTCKDCNKVMDSKGVQRFDMEDFKQEEAEKFLEIIQKEQDLGNNIRL